MQKKRLKKWLKIFVIIVVFTSGCLLAERYGLFKQLDDRFFDIFHIVQGQKSIPKNVVLVYIDTATFESLKNEPMAFWGPYFAKVISGLKKAGVKTIGLDVFFALSIESWFGKFGEGWEEKSRSYDIDFRRELFKGGIVLVCSFSQKEGKAKMQLPVNEYIYSLQGGLNDVGIANLIYDNDGLIRRFTHSYFDDLTPPHLSFASVLAKKQTGIDDNQSSSTEFNYINFYGPPGTFPSISFSEFLKEDCDNNPLIKGLKDKVVIIALGKDTKQDLHQTPYSTRFLHFKGMMMTGGEVHANIIETIISNSFFTDMSFFEKVIYIFIFSFISAFVFLKLGNISGAINIFILATINIFVAYTFFDNQIFVPATGVFLIIGINYLLSLAIKFSGEEKEKAYIKSMFERYVSGEVVKKMIDSGESPSLGGEMKEVTILFSDIRNFTMMSEMLKPHEVVEMLNRYFSIICDKIMKLDGTVDKFIGDAIMVIFGAPLYFEDHAERALEAALAINKDANEFSGWMKSRFGDKYPDLPQFKIGIGIHRGNVIIGNIGSIKRFEFTAIGDTVNIASRLEGLTKDSVSNILVSRALLSKVKKEVRTGESKMIKVKGKSVEVEVIEFFGFSN